MRSTQLDAVRLDDELASMLREQFMRAFAPLCPAAVARLQPELLLLLDFLVRRSMMRCGGAGERHKASQQQHNKVAIASSPVCTLQRPVHHIPSPALPLGRYSGSPSGRAGRCQAWRS